MAKRMLIDAAHPEETRVVVTGGHRLEEFDFESSTKKQVKGNIYLAKVTRVEPSLQAAFVDYGGNRHGFLAFSEIHPDYYRIPVSDRMYDEGEPEAADSHTEAGDDAGVPIATALPESVRVNAEAEGEGDPEAPDAPEAVAGDEATPMPGHDTGEAGFPIEAWPGLAAPQEPTVPAGPPPGSDDDDSGAAIPTAAEVGSSGADDTDPESVEDRSFSEPEAVALRIGEVAVVAAEGGAFADDYDPSGDGNPAWEASGDNAGEDRLTDNHSGDEHQAVSGSVETFGGDEAEDVEEADDERRRSAPTRHYKIQEVIKRRQIMLVQVAKEERGNKGAALTTYLSLAGRYCVLMPNTNRGGGVSRKITSIADRRRLKDILEELDIPEGMGVIVRTAGAERSKAEIKRDYEYLLRLWNEIRDLTLNSTAPALIYEEGNLIKRSIRDLYTRDIDEVLVEGEEGYKTAKAFMRTLMPSHAKRVQPYRDPQVPLFQRFQVEGQIDAIHSPVAQLRSGGYIVINQTEALVSIDVNSGRATRERNIEETALRTNLEAADEIARQLRLRDLAGLIVIDFIDMEEHRNQIGVERRLKEALKNDRARIQVGRISPFGLLEMSRQRLRPSLAETSTQPCPHCGGTGFIRSVESTALYVLRSIEEEGIRRRSAEICIYVPTNVALYILNQKRESVAQIEVRYSVKVMVARDDSLIPPSFRLERLRAFGAGEAPPLRAIQAPVMPADDDEEEAPEEAAEMTAGEESGEEERRARRRRRRRPRHPENGREARFEAREREAPTADGAGEPVEAAADGHGLPAGGENEDQAEPQAEADRRRRRRGRRGGRLRPRRDEPAAETIEVVPVAAGPAAEDAEPETWPTEMALAADDIETASLAPLAGEEASPSAAKPTAPDAAAFESSAAPADAEPAPTAEAGPGVPFVSERERRFEEGAAPEPAPEPQPEAGEEPEIAAVRPNDDVLVVTDKPPNPRRGWWKRSDQL